MSSLDRCDRRHLLAGSDSTEGPVLMPPELPHSPWMKRSLELCTQLPEVLQAALI